MGGGLASFWEQWNIQILVILSFGMQVILLFCAGIRRSRKASAILSILLWLGYLMADYTAIYALGHMSISMSRSPPRDHHQHQTLAEKMPLVPVYKGFSSGFATGTK